MPRKAQRTGVIRVRSNESKRVYRRHSLLEGVRKEGHENHVLGKRVPNCVKREDIDFCVNCGNLLFAEGLDENLKKWFKDKWVRFGPDGKIRGDCARGPT